MKSKIIKIRHERDLLKFKERYLEITGVSVDDEYLARADVYGLLTEPGIFNGGVIVNTTSPLRYEQYLSHEQLKEVRFFDDRKGTIVEITCLWINSEVFCTPRSRSRIQLLALMKAFLSGKKYILASTFSEKLARIQRLGFPYVIFEGYTEYFGKPMFHWLYYGTKASISIGVLKEIRRRFLF
jgi:hypothetical protein